MTQYQYLTGTLEASQLGQRLDQTLAKIFPNYSRSRIKSWILDGLVRVNGRIIAVPKEKIRGGGQVEVNAVIKEEPCWKAQRISLNIVYEDDNILVINKPRNMVVHPGINNDDGTLLNALLHYFPPIAGVPRAGIVHRLDKDTTGLMVVAKTVLAQTRLVKALQVRDITREYEAVVIGTMTTGGTVNQPIARHAIRRTHMVVHPLGRPAVTHYRIIEHFRAHTRLRLRLETGRTHQIRVHMAYINHPLVGNALYGRRQPLLLKGTTDASYYNEVLCRFDRQALHATMLRFYHPMSLREVEWHAPLPQDMLALIAALKADTTLFQESMD